MIGLVDDTHGVEHYGCGCIVQRWPWKDGKRRVRATPCSPEHGEALYYAVGDRSPNVSDRGWMTYDELEIIVPS